MYREKKISFEELNKLVSNIDYVGGFEYMEFIVRNDKKERVFCAGIGCFWGENQYEQIVSEEPQYLVESTDIYDMVLLDLQEPDLMVYDEIGRMLKEKCGINENSKIYLRIYDEETEDDGERMSLDNMTIEESLKKKLDELLKIDWEDAD